MRRADQRRSLEGKLHQVHVLKSKTLARLVVYLSQLLGNYIACNLALVWCKFTMLVACRRSAQLTQCGFHGPPSCPYKDVGEVELDDRRLIQEGLGQTSPGKEGKQQVRKTESNTVVSTSSIFSFSLF